MAHWPLATAAARNQQDLTSSEATLLTVTTGATAHTKGAWIELAAAVPSKAKGFALHMKNSNHSTGNSSMLMDIGIGASGSEIVVVANMLVGYLPNSSLVSPSFIPLELPDGVRVAVRSQGAIASDTVEVSVQWVMGQSFNAVSTCAACTTYGPSTANSQGVVLAQPSGSEKGAWTEVVAATTAPIHKLLATVQAGGQTSVPNSVGAIDIGVGAAGSEVAIVQHVGVGYSSSESVSPRHQNPIWPYLDFSIPTGTRLSARYERTGSSAQVDIAIHGFRR